MKVQFKRDAAGFIYKAKTRLFFTAMRKPTVKLIQYYCKTL